MSIRLPPDLIGGWAYNSSFKPVPLKKGQIWRKIGPIEALKIIRVMQPGHLEYDGGAPGISIVPTEVGSGGRIRWARQTWFRPGSTDDIYQFFQLHGYTLATNE